MSYTIETAGPIASADSWISAPKRAKNSAVVHNRVAYFHCWIIASTVKEHLMNKFVVSLLLSTFALGAQAQTASQAAVQVQDKSADVTVISGNDQANDRNCLRETGSHIVNKGNKKTCINANGKSFSRADIERTGTTDLADALRRLDPAITVHHN